MGLEYAPEVVLALVAIESGLPARRPGSFDQRNAPWDVEPAAELFRNVLRLIEPSLALPSGVHRAGHQELWSSLRMRLQHLRHVLSEGVDQRVAEAQLAPVLVAANQLIDREAI